MLAVGRCKDPSAPRDPKAPCPSPLPEQPQTAPAAPAPRPAPDGRRESAALRARQAGLLCIIACVRAGVHTCVRAGGQAGGRARSSKRTTAAVHARLEKEGPRRKGIEELLCGLPAGVGLPERLGKLSDRPPRVPWMSAARTAQVSRRTCWRRVAQQKQRRLSARLRRR